MARGNEIVPAGTTAWGTPGGADKDSPPTTPPAEGKSKPLSAQLGLAPKADSTRKAGRSKGRGMLGSTADKYKAAQERLFGSLQVKREPDAPAAKTLEETLAAEKAAREGGVDPDLMEDDDIELTSLAPPPHIDVVVQKQEHRLDSLDEIVDARLRIWTWKHIGGLVGIIWCSTIFLGMIICSLIYGIGLRNGSVDMGILYSEGVEIGPEGDDVAEAYMMLTGEFAAFVWKGNGAEGEEGKAGREGRGEVL